MRVSMKRSAAVAASSRQLRRVWSNPDAPFTAIPSRSAARSLTFEDTVAERVETAWRLRAEGQRIQAIAEQLGVSVSTVHNYLRARVSRERLA
jgi:DNA-binding NarL/FixJ family response regulator